MKQCKLILLDQVNIKFEGLDASCRRDISESLKIMVPYARHTPQFKMGRWDGKVAFATIGGGSYFNLLDQILPILVRHDYDIANMEIDDRRQHPNFQFKPIDENYFAKTLWPAGHPFAGQPIVMRDYQVEAINRYLENIQSIQCLSTGSGKTITTAALSHICEPYGRTIVVVPSKSLVVQTEEDYRNVGLDVGVFYGERKEYGHTHTIATWQSLGAFCKKKDDFNTIDGESFAEFIDGVVCVMIDECHSAKATILRDLLTGPFANIPIRWGMTGTIPKQKFEEIPLLVSLGPVVGEVRAKTLQDRGVLANCDIKVLKTDDSHISHKSYSSEYDFLVNDPKRVAWIASKIKECSGNTVILVDRISTANALHALIPEAVVVSGRTKMDARQVEFKDFNDQSNKIMIATFGVAAVGLNIPKINNLFAIEFGKSFVRCIQSIGRILRISKDKNHATVYDVCSNSKFSQRHLKERIKYYEEAEYPYTVSTERY